MKFFYSFIQINFILFKVIPSRYNAFMPTFFPIVETLVKFDFWNCLQSLLRFGLYLYNRVKTVSSEFSYEFWELPEVTRSQSGEYGDCGTICVEFLAKLSRRTSAVWDGALSWCKNYELSAQNIFWNGVEWSSWNANSVSKVSNCQSTIFVH